MPSELRITPLHVTWQDLEVSNQKINNRCLTPMNAMSLKRFHVLFQAPDEATLSTLSENLTQAGVAHKLWIEQPENIPTCLALKPCPKETVQPLLRKFKLFK